MEVEDHVQYRMFHLVWMLNVLCSNPKQYSRSVNCFLMVINLTGMVMFDSPGVAS